MKLKMTLWRANGPAVDIVVTTDASAPVGDVARAIAASDPYRQLGAAETNGVQTLMVGNPHGAREVISPVMALGESNLASGSSITVTDEQLRSPRSPGDGHLTTITVVEGPDKGKNFELGPGSRMAGRDPSVDILLSDPLVSKLHARFDVSPGNLRVVDLNSANGVVLDDSQVTRADLTDGQRILLGDTVLQVSIAASARDTSPPGPLDFTRSPRVERRYPGEEFIAPEMPSQQESQSFPWLAMIAPILMGGVMFAVTGSILSIVFVALSPVLLASNYVSNRANRKRKFRLATAAFRTRIAALDERLGTELAREHEVRLGEYPSTADVLQSALNLGQMLWTRRPEHWSFLSLRLGLAEMPSRNSIKVANEESALQEFLDEMRQVVTRHSTVAGVPVAESLYDSGTLGISGPRDLTAPVARALLVQLAGLHSPAEVVIAAAVSPEWTADLEWLKWLPHTSSPHSPISGGHLTNSAPTGAALLSQLEELIESRTTELEQAQRRRGATNIESSMLTTPAAVGSGAGAEAVEVPVPAVIFIVTDDTPIDRARLIQVAERGADAGVFPIWIGPSIDSLPAAARTFLDLSSQGDSGPVVGFVRLGTETRPVQVEHLGANEAMEFARALAPVSDAGALILDASDLPRNVPLVSLLGADLASDSTVAVDRWRQNDSIHDRSGLTAARSRRNGRLRALVGQSGLDAMHLDLRTQGPHALVGGTTGSGKSEFLQAWVLGMAAEYSPDRVTFLFVDYKGGSAFADCVDLPHCVGIVTDLSPHLVKRALTSLRAELRFREHLFNRKKVKDLLELERRGDPESPPALVLVIDEFAALVGEVPEFVDGVVDIAQRGRSLGIHLIMATQRPAGVIRDNLRANTNLRIALRMADEADSVDVVGDKIAALFDSSLPGRAVAKTGPGRLAVFQSGYAGGHTSSDTPTPSVEITELRFGADLLWELPDSELNVQEIEPAGPTDQARLVASLAKASKSAKIPAPRRPWLDELAPVFDLTKLVQRSDEALILGVSDRPENQQQDVIAFHPDADGSIAIFGAGGSGKSVTLRTLAAAAGVTPRGGPVSVYGLDYANGGLKMLEVLPHVGSIVGGDDPERVVRLLRMFRDQLEDRAGRYAAANAGSISEYRKVAQMPDEERLLLLVDGFPAFRQEFETASARAPWYQIFQQIVSEGRQLGMHVALSADRPGSVPTSVGSGIQRRVILRLTDDASYSLLDVSSDILSSKSPPGRAIIDGLETQVAIVGGSQSLMEQSRSLDRLAESITRAGRSAATAIGFLPREYPSTDLPDAIGGLPVLGISDDDLGPVGFEPTGGFLLSGPPGSGRSNALASMVSSLKRALPDSRMFYFGNSRSGLAHLDSWEGKALLPDQVSELASRVAAEISKADAQSKICVIIESISEFLSSPADAPLVELIKAVKRSDHFLLADAESGSWGSSWPLLAEVKAVRRGLLLQPDYLEGETILKTALPRGSRADFPAGRGFYISRGKAVRVQLPLVR